MKNDLYPKPLRRKRRLGHYLLSIFFSAMSFLPQLAIAQSDHGNSNGTIPSARWGHVMANDPIRDKILLFGGAPTRTEMLDETWEWDGSKWEKLDVSGPTPRAYAAMAFDAKRKRIVLHGGRNSERVSLSDMWEWDGNRWQQVATAGPSGRDHHAVVFDEARGLMVLFGGYGDGKVHGDTWQWDGRAWSQIHSAGPPPRAAFDMAYDADKRTTILYGGLWLGGLYADIWEWDGKNWMALAAPYANPTLDHHVAAYDAKRQQYLIFGGKNYRFTAMGRTSILQNGQIKEIAGDGPAPRYNTAMVYDGRREQMVLFGGRIRDGEDFIAYGDTWIWNGAKWREAIKDESKSRREENLKAEVLNAVAQFSAAFLEADAEKLNLLLAPDYRYTNTDGSVVSRERWLEWIKSRREKITSGELKIENYNNEDVEVVLLSPTITVATGRNIASGVESGKPFRTEIRFTHVWVKQNNKWQRTVFHDSRITEWNTRQ